jgi:hypothetical protein
VIDVDGKVLVAAHESDVNIHVHGAAARKSKPAESMEVTVRQGEQVTREERCGAAAKIGEVIDAKAGILNSPWAVGSGAAAIGILTCWALCRGDDPISPSKP